MIKLPTDMMMLIEMMILMDFDDDNLSSDALMMMVMRMILILMMMRIIIMMINTITSIGGLLATYFCERVREEVIDRSCVIEIFVLSLITLHNNVIVVKFHDCRLFHCYDSEWRQNSDNLIEIGSKFQIPEQVLHLKRKVVVPQH